MEKDSFFEIFSILSKAVIVVPIVVVIIGLVYKFNEKKNSSNQSENLITPTVFQKQKTNSQSKINIDLKGPLVCQGKLEEASIAAYIKDKKIKIIIDRKIEVENILISDDCFYNWDEGEFSGKRICGLSPFISVAEMSMNFGGMSADVLLNQLASLGIKDKIATDQAKIVELINACKKEEIVNQQIFAVPTNVLFKNAK